MNDVATAVHSTFTVNKCAAVEAKPRQFLVGAVTMVNSRIFPVYLQLLHSWLRFSWGGRW
jgi:hypothetical protein